MNKHTPTPWQVETNNLCRDVFIGPVMGGKRIAEVFSPFSGNGERHKENAAIIVHRVNTYDALVEALENLTVYGNGPKGSPTFDSAMSKARAALKLARGEA